MNLRKKNMWSEEMVKAREYQLLKCLLLVGKTGDLDKNKQYKQEISQILNDSEYQEIAIKLEKDSFNYTSLIGMVTPMFMIANFQKISPEIMDRLLSNILLNYQDDERCKPLMFVGDIDECSYIYAIVCQKNLSLKKEYQARITDGIIKIIQTLLIKQGDELKNDLELVYRFLFRKDIELVFRMRVIDSLTSDHISLFYKGMQNGVGINCKELMTDFDEMFDFFTA